MGLQDYFDLFERNLFDALLIAISSFEYRVNFQSILFSLG